MPSIAKKAAPSAFTVGIVPGGVGFGFSTKGMTEPLSRYTTLSVVAVSRLIFVTVSVAKEAPYGMG